MAARVAEKEALQEGEHGRTQGFWEHGVSVVFLQRGHAEESRMIDGRKP